ncbi:alpha/beta hydrolase family protein [Micromonospora sp. SH-82]|uniref:alpha/beta hydrolase family protein n=1 Tax=Micromonospora sp. SH-82 TaxID=3132938 RepID=UPI003EC06C76
MQSSFPLSQPEPSDVTRTAAARRPVAPPTRRPRRRRRTRGLFAVALVGALAVTGAAPTPPAGAAENPYQRGPEPTAASIAATRGPFAVAEVTVSSLQVSGFGGGTVYYPTSTSEGTFGAVAIAPGYTAGRSTMAWLGPRLASQGFVVFNIDTLSRYDQPSSRARQLLAALDHLTRQSPVRDRLDPDRLAVMGHSMGGGGALEAADSRPGLRAAVPLTPWHLTKGWSGVRVPTLVVGAESDTVAPVRSHAELFYESLGAGVDKAYLELNAASHFAPNSPNTTIASFGISWLKRFVDDDTRYEKFLCPPPRPGTQIEEYRDSCPHSS